jgi:hypothetical protein
MTSKKLRAPTSLKLNINSLKLKPEKSKSDSARSYPHLDLISVDRPLIVDEYMIVTSLAVAQDYHFLLNNNVTHVINCVSSSFPSEQFEGITYLNLSMQDSMEQDLVDPIV